MQSFLSGGCGKRQLVLAFSNVGDGCDAGAASQFAHGHAKCTIDLFGWNYPRTSNSRRGNNQNSGRILPLVRSVSRSPLGHPGYSFSTGCSYAESPLPMFASDFDDFPAKRTRTKQILDGSTCVRDFLKGCRLYWHFASAGQSGIVKQNEVRANVKS